MANLNDTIINALESKGFRRWTKGRFDRLYINAGALGLRCEYYGSGNIKHAYFGGSDYTISNSEARRMKGSKTYIDLSDGCIYSDNDTLKAACQELLDTTIASLAA